MSRNQSPKKPMTQGVFCVLAMISVMGCSAQNTPAPKEQEKRVAPAPKGQEAPAPKEQEKKLAPAPKEQEAPAPVDKKERQSSVEKKPVIVLVSIESRQYGTLLEGDETGGVRLGKRDFLPIQNWIMMAPDIGAPVQFENRVTAMKLSVFDEVIKEVPANPGDPNAKPPVAATPAVPATHKDPVVRQWGNPKEYVSDASMVRILQQWQMRLLSNNFYGITSGNANDPPDPTDCVVLTAEPDGKVSLKPYSPGGFNASQQWLIRQIR